MCQMLLSVAHSLSPTDRANDIRPQRIILACICRDTSRGVGNKQSSHTVMSLAKNEYSRVAHQHNLGTSSSSSSPSIVLEFYDFGR